MALLLEGLDVGGDTSIEEYVISPDNDLAGNQDHEEVKDRIKLYGAEEGQSWIAKPVAGQSTLGMASRHGSMANRSMLMDPLVTLFGSVHEKAPEMGMGSMRSMLFSNFGSMFNVSADNQPKNENWDEESLQRDDDNASDNSGNDSDDNLRSPLLRQDSNAEKENQGEQLSSVGIGGGWQLAYRKDEKSSGGVKRIYLHQEGGGAAASRRGSLLSVAGGDGPADGGDLVHAAALVSHSVLRADDVMSHQSIGLATEKQPKAAAAAKGPSWRELFEPGVKHALIVGVGLQILQQVKKILSNIHYFRLTFASSYYTAVDYIYRTFPFFPSTVIDMIFRGTCFLSRFMNLTAFTVKPISTPFHLFSSGELLGSLRKLNFLKLVPIRYCCR